MEKLLAIYFSGTGNTRFVVRKFCEQLSLDGVAFKQMSIEDAQDFKEEMRSADTVLIAYPIYGSDIPPIMKAFLDENAQAFYDKEIITIVTQASFSGDGAGLAVKRLRKHGMKCKHKASIHINMPSNISDLTIFKVKNAEENQKTLAKAQQKIDNSLSRLLCNKKIKDGRHIYSWFLGFFGQRLWGKLFLGKRLKSALKIDKSLCIGCGMCVMRCPNANIELSEQKAVPKKNCTACYRCINLCPQRAISLLSKKKPKNQYRGV